jgi:hypothetical protein
VCTCCGRISRRQDDSIAGTIENLGGRTEHLASHDAGHVFLNIQDRNTVLRLDSQALKVLDTWSLTVVDGNGGRIVTMQPIGRGVDATEFDPDKGLIFFSTGGGDGALSVFHEDSPDKYTLVESVKTQAGARTMALDRKTGRVYLSVAKFGAAPEATPANPRPRPPMLPGTFGVLVLGQ